VLSREGDLAIALEAHEVGDSSSVGGALVDMGARLVDPAAAIQQVAAARLPVVAVAQHDDQVTRRRAMAAGAIRVFSYNKFFTDGTRLVERWFTSAGSAAGASQPPRSPRAPSRSS
jgi:hypothetical protein